MKESKVKDLKLGVCLDYPEGFVITIHTYIGDMLDNHSFTLVLTKKECIEILNVLQDLKNSRPLYYKEIPGFEKHFSYNWPEDDLYGLYAYYYYDLYYQTRYNARYNVRIIK
jgi:hypothetical protein